MNIFLIDVDLDVDLDVNQSNENIPMLEFMCSQHLHVKLQFDRSFPVYSSCSVCFVSFRIGELLLEN